MKPTQKMVFLLVIICNLFSCVNVDIARGVITPSIAGLVRNHGYANPENKMLAIPRPPGTLIEQTRLASKDGIADIAVTHLT